MPKRWVDGPTSDPDFTPANSSHSGARDCGAYNAHQSEKSFIEQKRAIERQQQDDERRREREQLEAKRDQEREERERKREQEAFEREWDKDYLRPSKSTSNSLNEKHTSKH